jgi:hypothetical protein
MLLCARRPHLCVDSDIFPSMPTYHGALCVNRIISYRLYGRPRSHGGGSSNVRAGDATPQAAPVSTGEEFDLTSLLSNDMFPYSLDGGDSGGKITTGQCATLPFPHTRRITQSICSSLSTEEGMGEAISFYFLLRLML